MMGKPNNLKLYGSQVSHMAKTR